MLCSCVCLLAAVVVAATAHDNSPFPTAEESVKVLWNATWTDRLKHDLLMKYDKFARPAQHTDVTTVNFNLIIKHIEIDELRSIMVVNGWTNLQWEDDKLKWNSTDYGGLSKLTVGDHEVWQPDIVLYNSALGNSLDHYGNTHCVVMEDGKVSWVPPSQFSVHCDINLRRWPYDRHTCYFYFGSWVYDGEQIHLKRPINSSDGKLDMEPCDWSVISFTEVDNIKYYACCSEPYYNIEVIVEVQRRSPAYAAVAFTPAFVCVVLTLSVFWLPPSASEKFLLSGVTAVIISMFLVYFSQRLPSMGEHTPLIVEFYAYNLLLVCLSLVVSVVSVSLSRRPSPRPLPWALNRILSGPLANYLCLPTNKGSFRSMYEARQSVDCEELHERSLVGRGRTESVDTTSPQVDDGRASAKEWALLAAALDRLMFIVYLTVFTFIAAAFYIS